MVDDRPQADRILVAQLMGEARHHAKWHDLTEDEEAAAAAALRELARSRADLLAEVAGLAEGFAEGELDEPLARQAARLCLLAGADEAAIPAWVEEGRRRRDAARMPPPWVARMRRPADLLAETGGPSLAGNRGCPAAWSVPPGIGRVSRGWR